MNFGSWLVLTLRYERLLIEHLAILVASVGLLLVDSFSVFSRTFFHISLQKLGFSFLQRRSKMENLG